MKEIIHLHHRTQSSESGLHCNGGNDYKLPHIGKLKIAAANSRDIPMQLPCRALIAGDHLNADAITSAIISSEQDAPARLFFIVIFLIAVSPLPLLIVRRRPSRSFLITTPSRRCCCRCRRHRASIVSIAPPPIRRRPVALPFAVLSCCRCPSRTRRCHPSRVDCDHNRRPSKCCSGPPRPLPRGHRRG
jgi:hypothetical protein